jgi:drug/metabolite transporter (DMT)-like permease
MSYAHLGLILLCVLGISVGQILFKSAALISTDPQFGYVDWKIVFHPYTIIGVAIYAAATLLWIWMLRVVPLNLAYPLMGLAFVIVPVMGALFLGEPFKPTMMIGGLLIAAGIYLAEQ